MAGGPPDGIGQPRPGVSPVRPGAGDEGILELMPNEAEEMEDSDDEVIEAKPEGMEGERIALQD